ncbi:MAG: Bcr/CflA family drug resistance efflux transporter [Burkholderiales bacterium RIFCSPLOWO2_12_FULL_64_99]|jgi:DHA1 family bicyclomycin/chloramphenicol resistance-like MFS transporter|nr:MAG: Bcr/CflA family drug resistance efflux transporter [Burkholderiales bacterium RIFCSPHIGHO2_12_FULL_63_20]OGB61895.1 MAG: Bcr/CflA family drug resistance efflux transporter [Burkholderiales bacterium RIFCSPLOWO2_12_FULL_64_99]
MNPDSRQLWRGPMWALSVLLATLGMLGPFTIDTYLPAFSGIAADLQATPLQIQQTLSAYLFAFAFMSLFHGALSDSFGRRPVVLTGVAVFTLASVGCALSTDITHLIFFRALQGLATGAGIVVSRAVIRDMFPPADAQRVMSQVTLFFGVAPAIAPIIGGFLFVHAGWHAVFWFLAGIGVLLWVSNWFLLPETLHVSQRQVLSVKHLMQGYWQLGSNPRFVLLALASGIPFNGMFLYVLSAPTFLGEHLQLAPTQFFWFFVCTISGIMGGAWLSGRLAGRIAPERQVRIGLGIMLAVSVVNVVANLLFKAHVSWSMIPIGVYSLGWAMMTPVVTLMVLDLFPERRGMAASMQAFVGSAANGLVAGVLAPMVMHSTIGLAVAALLLMMVGLIAWGVLQRR